MPIRQPSWRTHRSELLEVAVCLMLVFVIEAVYVFIVSAGNPNVWPQYMSYYDLLADGFRAGHLHLAIEPPPELLAQKDPFDVAHARFWLGDASLYGGHYYFYWGPLPALLLAGVKSALGISRPVGDQYLVFAFFSLAAVATTALLRDLRRRLFPRLPLSLFALSVLACALGNPVLHLLGSSSVYQAAISGGQAFLMAGLCFAFSAVHNQVTVARWKLPVAGLMWACALACRVSLAPAVFLLVIITAVLAHPISGRVRLAQVIRQGVAVALPVAIGCIGLLVYNKLRFGGWLESGVRFQLTTWVFRFSPRYFLANIEQYLFRAPTISCHFPFLVVPYEVNAADVVPRWIPFREGYMTPEPVAGMAWAFPLVWWVPVPLLLAVMNLREVFAKTQTVVPTLPASRADWQRVFLWCAAAFAVLSSVTLLAPLGLYLATMRYLGDIRFGVALLGTLGLWVLHARAHRLWQRRLWTGSLVAVPVAVIAVGLLLGYQGYTGHFEDFNPSLSAALARGMSFCK